MPKKSRRAKEKRRSRSAVEIRRETSRTPEQVVAEHQSPTRVSPELQSLASRYQYLLPELRHIGILAGAIIVILVVLSFILD